VTRLHMATVALTVRLRLSEEVLANYLPASPQVVGEELAEAVQGLVREQKLGYFPALEYFRAEPGMDEGLLDAVDHIAWLATSLVRDEVRRRLRPVFASVRFSALQALAFTLPPVRPGQPQAFERLARHYTPDTVKADLLLDLVQKGPPPMPSEAGDAAAGGTDGDPGSDLGPLAGQMVRRWLAPCFAELEITAARSV